MSDAPSGHKHSLGRSLSRSRLVAGGLLLVAGMLVALSLATRYVAYRADVAGHGSDRAAAWIAVMKLFDVNSETNVPSWFSSSLLLGGAVVTVLVAVLMRRSGGRDVGRWLALAGVLALLSLDESAALHERLGEPAATLLGGTGAEVPRFAWVVPGALFAVIVGAFFVGFLVRLPGRVRVHLLGSGVGFLTASVVLETVSGAVLDAHGHRAGYLLVTAAEEGAEMAASIWLVYAVLSCLSLNAAPGGRYEVSLSDQFAKRRVGAATSGSLVDIGADIARHRPRPANPSTVGSDDEQPQPRRPHRAPTRR